MGCDVFAPSDMMDGRIGKIRKSLDKNGLPNDTNFIICCKVCFKFLWAIS